MVDTFEKTAPEPELEPEPELGLPPPPPPRKTGNTVADLQIAQGSDYGAIVAAIEVPSPPLVSAHNGKYSPPL